MVSFENSKSVKFADFGGFNGSIITTHRHTSRGLHRHPFLNTVHHVESVDPKSIRIPL
jgi:hypothetical protein